MTQITSLWIQKYTFRVYGSMFSEFMDLSDTNYKFVDLNDPHLQVVGSPVHFTLYSNRS